MNNPMGRASFLAAAQKLKCKWIPVPELGSDVAIRELTAGKAMELGANVRTDDREAMLLWVIASVLDPTTGVTNEAGEVDLSTCTLMFTEAALPELRVSMASAIMRIGTAAVELTGLGKSPEELAKNSAASPV